MRLQDELTETYEELLDAQAAGDRDAVDKHWQEALRIKNLILDEETACS